jgi:hypothetical protein
MIASVGFTGGRLEWLLNEGVAEPYRGRMIAV